LKKLDALTSKFPKALGSLRVRWFVEVYCWDNGGWTMEFISQYHIRSEFCDVCAAAHGHTNIGFLQAIEFVPQVQQAIL